MSETTIPNKQLLYSRKSAAEALNTSVDTVKRLERQGRLRPIRLTGPRSSVFFPADQVRALAKGDLRDG